LNPIREVEIIVLFSKKATVTDNSIKRIPPSKLAGKIKILSDIISPVVDGNEWNAMQ